MFFGRLLRGNMNPHRYATLIIPIVLILAALIGIGANVAKLFGWMQ